MLKINEIIVVEGKYDRALLSGFIDTVILETGGFRIFKNEDLRRSLRKLSENRGIVIMTDSDSAGFVIRNYLSGIIPSDRIINAYIPVIPGKERRKNEYSAEGILGVEGMTEDIIVQSLLNAGVVPLGVDLPARSRKEITKMTLYDLGLYGGPNSAEMRNMLVRHLDLPPYLSAARLAEVLSCLYDKNELENLCEEVFGKNGI